VGTVDIEKSSASASSRAGGGWVSALPQALVREAERTPWRRVAELARARMHGAAPSLSGQIADAPVEAFGLRTGFFYLPVAQARAWGVHNEPLLTEFLSVLAVGHYHFHAHDLVIDEGQCPAASCLLSDVCLLSYLDGLRRLANGSSTYRRLHDRYYDAYGAAIVRDLAHRARLHPYSAGDILGLGDKAAPGATAMHVAADLAGRDSGPGTVRALLRLCTGLQLVDDLNDAAIDARVGNRTWPVTGALLAYPDLDPHDGASVEAAVVGSGVARAALRLAEEAFQDAAGIASKVDARIVADLAGVWTDRCQERRAHFHDALALV
jgi:hypothetical protein